MDSIYKQFITGLEKIYGKYNPHSKGFAKKSNSEIARELFYSDSQFSRLINQTASQGEYNRANKIIRRYQDNLNLKSEIARLKSSRHQSPSLLKTYLLVGTLSVILVSSAYFLGKKYSSDDQIKLNYIEDSSKNKGQDKMDHFLHWAFENSEVKSYTYLNDLPEDCNYPCYRLQGKWTLENEYKLPIFSENRGFHYVAKEVEMYARCSGEEDHSGSQLEGYEYQKHEIWYDKRELPIDPFLQLSNSSELKIDYTQLDFATSENFYLVAHVHTFFRNEFIIEGNELSRKGYVLGRKIDHTDLNPLAEEKKEIRTENFKNKINRIVQQRVKDYSKPVQCDPYQFSTSSFHRIEEGQTMNYHCYMTTGRFPISYNKTFVLENQIIKNACRPEL